MTDNLNIKGIESDEFPQGARRVKPRGKRRKPWVIETRVQRHVSNGLARDLGLWDWWIHSRYTTRARRDQAYATMVKRMPSQPYWWKLEYRKRDD